MGCSSSQCGKKSRARAEDSPSGFHGQYVVGRQLGLGAFGQVLTAVHAKTGETVAVKVEDARETLHRVEREVKALKHVATSQHCVRYLESFVDSGFSFIVMEKCKGPLVALLDAYSGDDNFNEWTLRRIVREMAACVASIHALGVVHRDLKPPNFLFTGEASECKLKLCDFGLASILELGGGKSDTLAGLCGTTYYCSPEMVAGHRYGQKTDVWSIGVIAYLLLFGRFPYCQRNSKTLKENIASGRELPNYDDENVSDSAIAFVKRLLARFSHCRLTAAEALEEPWLAEAGLPDAPRTKSGLPSAKPAFLAAKRHGAFEVKNGQVCDGFEDMQKHLRTRQLTYHGSHRVGGEARANAQQPPPLALSGRSESTNSGSLSSPRPTKLSGVSADSFAPSPSAFKTAGYSLNSRTASSGRGSSNSDNSDTRDVIDYCTLQKTI